MKRVLILILMMLPPFVCHAELVEVFQCESEVNRKTGTDDSDVFYQPTKKVGIIETGAESFSKIVQLAAAKSWQGEPFYGPAVKLLIKDTAGRVFIVHFEFKRGDPTIGKGFRFAVIEAKTAGKDRWQGDPYQGSSVVGNEVINKALQRIVEKP